MGDHFEVSIEDEDSSPHFTSSLSGCAISLYLFPSRLHNLLCSPPFLLTLCLATSTMGMFLHTAAMPFRCVAFLLHVGFSFVFSHLIVSALIFYIERRFVMKKTRVLYFVFALKTSVQYFFCFSSILLSAWFLFTKPAEMNDLLVNLVMSTTTTCVIASVLSILKIVILKALDCRFRDKSFFLNMHDVISHEYVLQTLLRPSARGSILSDNGAIRAKLIRIKATFAYMLLFSGARLHTVCDAIEKSNLDNEHQVENEILELLKNLTNNEPRDINETDLLRFMEKEDLEDVLLLFEGAIKTKRISEASFRKWMITVYNKRKLVLQSLNNTSNVIEQLNKIVSVNLSFFVALLWCLLMGLGTTKFLLFISSHLLLLVLFFGDYCQMICEGILLAIVMHPFDVGDYCIIENEQLMVEDIGLINTIFIKDNNEKVNCLNSVLLTKSISNLNRSSKLKDTFELLVSSATSSHETIAALKIKIAELLGSNRECWRDEHCFDLKGTDNVTHKYNLQISYATHFQNYEEMNYRRSELVLKLRKLLEELDIKDFTIQ